MLNPKKNKTPAASLPGPAPHDPWLCSFLGSEDTLSLSSLVCRMGVSNGAHLRLL